MPAGTKGAQPSSARGKTHIDSQPRLRLFSWHCPLPSALASATAPASPMPFPDASQPHIPSKTAAHPQSVSIPKAPPTPSPQRAHTRHRPTDKEHASRNETRTAQQRTRQRHIDSLLRSLQLPFCSSPFRIVAALARLSGPAGGEI